MPEPDERAAPARAAEVLGDADEVALACHLNPDADALGSMLGLSNFLRGSWRRDRVLVRERAVRPTAVVDAPAGCGSPRAARRVPR